MLKEVEKEGRGKKARGSRGKGEKWRMARVFIGKEIGCELRCKLGTSVLSLTG